MNDDVPQVRFIVMNNLFCTGLPIHRRYDLKGSTQGRGAGVEAPPAGSGVILKDLDLDVNLKLEEGWHDRCCHLWNLMTCTDVTKCKMPAA